MLLVTAPRVVVRPTRDNDVFFIYDALQGNAISVGRQVAGIVEEFRSPSSVSDVALKVNLPATQVQKVLDNLIEKGLILSAQNFDKGPPESAVQKYPLRVLRLFVTKTCNMACTYCFEPEHVGTRMDLKTLVRAAKAYRVWLSKHSDQSYELVKINFFGGEPLVCIDLLKQAVPEIKQIYADLDRRWKVTLNTNATLVTKDIAQWIVENDICIYTSLDGLAETNDEQRIFRSGRGTFEKTLAGLKNLVEVGGRDWAEENLTVLCTVTSKNLPEIERLAHLLKEAGVRNLAFNAAFSCAAVYPQSGRPDNHWTSMSQEETRNFVRRAVALQKELLSDNFHIGGMWAHVPERLREGGAVFCQAVGNEVGIDPDGNLYPCPTTIGNHKACMGKLTEEGFVFNEEAQNWGHRTNDRMEKCQSCSIQGICRGGCPASAWLNGHDIYEAYQCDYWFTIVDSYLENYLWAT